MSEESEWGQLVSLTDFESEPVAMKTDTFTIGRAFGCDLSLSDNKLVSGQHCHIDRNTDGEVTLHDTSTNGTLLNMKKLCKGQSRLLRHGDEIYLVYKKNNEELNVGYIYQSTEELQKEEGTQEYTPEVLDATLEDTDCNNYSLAAILPTSSNKRKSTDNDSEDESASSSKKPKVDESKENGCTEKKADLNKDMVSVDQNVENKPSDDGKSKVCKKEETPEGKSKLSEDTRDDIEENLQCIICQEIMHDCISLQPCLHSFCAGCYSDWMTRSQECPSCRKKVERINKNHIVNNLIEAYLKEHPGKKRPSEDIEDLNKKNKITHDMLYPREMLSREDSSDYGDTDDNEDDDNNVDPPLANPPVHYFAPPPQPVLFGFGTPVFGGNTAYKTVCRQCPEYKEPVAGGTGVISGIKNALNTVKNLITGDSDTGKPGPSDATEEPASTGSDTEPTTSGEPGTSSETDQPSTSGENTKIDKPAFKEDLKEMPVAPQHVCAPLQNHVLCQCCLQPMPDHRLTTNLPVADRRPQQCGVCYRAFCHPYWGCRKADCLGCLNKFKEMNFGRKCLPGLILDNQFESEIFKDYIDSKGLSVKDVLQECCRQMEAGRFSVTAQGTHRLTTDTPVCYGCGLYSFKQLAFQFRKTLKQEDLPDKALNRADCYWGSKCRTQRNKPHHARNFNHICDQTRQF